MDLLRRLPCNLAKSHKAHLLRGGPVGMHGLIGDHILPAAHTGIEGHQPAAQRHGHGHNVVSHLRLVVVRTDAHIDAPLRSRLHIDLIQTNAVCGNDLALLEGIDHFLRQIVVLVQNGVGVRACRHDLLLAGAVGIHQCQLRDIGQCDLLLLDRRKDMIANYHFHFS